jgi:hypothetical protein
MVRIARTREEGWHILLLIQAWQAMARMDPGSNVQGVQEKYVHLNESRIPRAGRQRFPGVGHFLHREQAIPGSRAGRRRDVGASTNQHCSERPSDSPVHGRR